MINWKIESCKIKDLKKHPHNPRRISHEQINHLKKSINRFGFIDKPIINLDGTIIAGHQRIEVMKKNGDPFIDCWVPEKLLDEKDVNDLNLMHNRVHGDFDYDILANEYEIVDLLECGFTAEELLDINIAEEIEPKKEKKEKVKECPHCGQPL